MGPGPVERPSIVLVDILIQRCNTHRSAPFVGRMDRDLRSALVALILSVVVLYLSSDGISSPHGPFVWPFTSLRVKKRPAIDRERPVPSRLRCADVKDVEDFVNGTTLRLSERTTPSPRIFDAFIYNNEVDMLRVHLDELASVVDIFILVEATKTFQGSRKRLHFEETARHEPWIQPVLHKIRHISVDDMPRCDHDGAWECEYHQRNAMLRAMNDVRSHDIVIIGDVDEILRSSTVETIRSCNVPLPSMIRTDFYYYSLRWKKKFEWTHPNVVFGKHVGEMSMETLRRSLIQDSETRAWTHLSKSTFRRGGWHLSYFMNVDEIIEKIHSFSHTEYNEAREEGLLSWDDPIRILKAACTGQDIFARDDRAEGLQFVSSFLDNAPACVASAPDLWPRFAAYDPLGELCRPYTTTRFPLGEIPYFDNKKESASSPPNISPHPL